eukprot:SAG31_NODE_17812_length_657_cov_0.645161_1_plen_104_part_00
MEESGRVEVHEDDAACMARSRRAAYVPVIVAGTLLTVHAQPNFFLNLFSGHLQLFVAQVGTVFLSLRAQPAHTVLRELSMAMAQLFVGVMSMSMLIGLMAFTS